MSGALSFREFRIGMFRLLATDETDELTHFHVCDSLICQLSDYMQVGEYICITPDVPKSPQNIDHLQAITQNGHHSDRTLLFRRQFISTTINK